MSQKTLQNTLSVQDFLTYHKIAFHEITHPALFTVEQAKELWDTIPGCHTKNIFIRIKKWPYALIVLKADKKLDTQLFKLQTGISNFSFASSEEVQDQLGVLPWSIWIFWLINNDIDKDKRVNKWDITLYIDQDVRSSEKAWWHPNINTSTIILTKSWLSDYLYIIKNDYKVIFL